MRTCVDRSLDWIQLAAQLLDLRGRRVLIIDDNSMAREVLASMLTSMTFIVDEAASGIEGIEMVRLAAAAGNPYEIAFSLADAWHGWY